MDDLLPELEKRKAFLDKSDIHPNLPIVEGLEAVVKAVKDQKIEINGAELVTIKGEKGDTVVGPPGPPGPKGDKPVAGIDYQIPKNGESIVGPPGPPGKDGSPDTGDQIIDKINLSDERINRNRIEGLDKLEERIKKVELKPSGGAIAGRDLFQDIDISSQLNGVLKTFNIQAVWRIISVDIDSYPYGAARNVTDYTWTPTSITFGDSIDASTQLGSGQKCKLTVVLA